MADVLRDSGYSSSNSSNTSISCYQVAIDATFPLSASLSMESTFDHSASTSQSKQNGTNSSCLDSKTVADVKGASQTSRKKQPTAEELKNRISLFEVIRYLTDPNTGLYPTGVTPKQISDYMSTMPESGRPCRSRNHLHVELSRQMALNLVARVKTGKYLACEFMSHLNAAQSPLEGRPPNGTILTGQQNNSVIKKEKSKNSGKSRNTKRNAQQKTAASASEFERKTTLVDDDCGSKTTTKAAASSFLNSAAASVSGGDHHRVALLPTDTAESTVLLDLSAPDLPKNISADNKNPILVRLPKSTNESSSTNSKKTAAAASRKRKVEQPTSKVEDALPSNPSKRSKESNSPSKSKRKCAKKPVKKKRPKTASQLIRCLPDPFKVPVCDYCLLAKRKNALGRTESVLTCKDCFSRAHPTCMGYSYELAERSGRSPWQCIDCKTCAVCQKAEDGEQMLFCDSCDKGYHMSCHEPEVQEKPLGKWVCGRCEFESILAINQKQQKNKQRAPKNDATQSNGASEHVIVSATVGSEQKFLICDKLMREITHRENDYRITLVATSNLDDLFEKSSKCAAQWSIEQVAEFVGSLGYAEHAQMFLQQEIDGPSMLLLRRQDVLTRLGLKLGPALKLYNRLLRLQTMVAENAKLLSDQAAV